jgi:hypothetical protein
MAAMATQRRREGFKEKRMTMSSDRVNTECYGCVIRIRSDDFASAYAKSDEEGYHIVDMGMRRSHNN